MVLANLILNGIQLIPSSIFIANIEGLFNSTNSNNLNDLISDGSTVGTTKINSKSINMKIAVQDSIGLMEQIKHYKHLNFLLNQKKIQIEFKYEGEEDYFYIECIKESISYQEFNIIQAVLISPNPYVLKRDFKELSLGKRKDGGFIFYSSGFNFSSKGFSFNEREIGNNGIALNSCYYTVFPLIELKGDEVTSVTIKNKTSAETLKVNIDLSVNEKLIVDCRLSSRGVYKVDETGVQKSVIKNKTGTWISLLPGENNLEIVYTGSKAVATVKWREVWI